MALPERDTPWFFQNPCNSSWGRDGNSSIYFTDQVQGYSVFDSFNCHEPSHSTDVSLMKFALDISLDLNPKCVSDYRTSKNKPLIANAAPMHLHNDAPSEFANLTPTHIEFSPTADLCPSIMQSLSTGSMAVIEESNIIAEWIEGELRSFAVLSDATHFAVDALADLQNGFSPVASIEITDQQQQQVESPSAFDRGPPNAQPIPAHVPVVPFFDGLTPRPHTTCTKYDENPPNVYYNAGYGEQFSGHENLQEHLAMHSSDQTYASSSDKKFVNNRILENKTGEKKFACNICQKKFTRQDGLQGHMTIHNSEKAFACSICGKNFARNIYLKKHMVIHTEEKKFGCDICNMRFGQKSSLTRHMPIHTRVKEFACQVCNKEFARHKDLKAHMTIHTGDKMFACPICGKNFACNRYLRNHVVIHTEEKKFACDVCNKSFTCDRYLIKHMDFHTGGKKFKCDVCGKSRINLQNHMIVHSREKKFACDICNKTFGRKAGLEKHITIHIGVKEFACQVCNKEFAQCHKLRAHMRTHWDT